MSSRRICSPAEIARRGIEDDAISRYVGVSPSCSARSRSSRSGLARSWSGAHARLWANSVSPWRSASPSRSIVASSGHLGGARQSRDDDRILVSRPVRSSDVIPYVVAQCVGAVLASLLCGWLVGPVGGFGVTHSILPIAQSFVVEMGFRGLLGFVIMAVATDDRTPRPWRHSRSGATVFAGALVTGPSRAEARSGEVTRAGGGVGKLDRALAVLGRAILGTMAAMRLYNTLRSTGASEGLPSSLLGVEGPLGG